MRQTQKTRKNKKKFEKRKSYQSISLVMSISVTHTRLMQHHIFFSASSDSTMHSPRLQSGQLLLARNQKNRSSHWTKEDLFNLSVHVFFFNLCRAVDRDVGLEVRCLRFRPHLCSQLTSNQRLSHVSGTKDI